ncbi:hypothetical protein DJ74_04690, partial [Halorubrum sp. Ea8]
STNRGEFRQLLDRQPEFLHDIRHFTEDIEESAVRKVEVFAKSVESDDHPVCVATFPFLDRLISVTPDSFLRQSHTSVGEAGEFRRHIELCSLHFLEITPFRQYS